MSEQWKTGGDESEMPGGEGNADETGMGGPSRPRVSKNTLAVLGVFAITLALIWALGRQSGPRDASASEGSDDQVESAMKDLMGSGKGDQVNNLFRDSDQIVKMFYNYPGVSSVPLDELPVNPFEHNAAHAPEPSDPMPTATVNPSFAEEARLHKLAESFNKLKLTTVLISKNNANSAALINNRLVSIGGKIGEFTLTEIAPQSVILSAGAAHFELKLDEPRGNRLPDSDDP